MNEAVINTKTPLRKQRSFCVDGDKLHQGVRSSSLISAS